MLLPSTVSWNSAISTCKKGRQWAVLVTIGTVKAMHATVAELTFTSVIKDSLNIIGIVGIVIGIIILLLLCRLMVMGKILIFENLGVGTLPTPPN